MELYGHEFVDIYFFIITVMVQTERDTNAEIPQTGNFNEKFLNLQESDE